MLLKQPFKSFNLTPESRRSASLLESYAQMKISKDIHLVGKGFKSGQSNFVKKFI